jgi:predicted ATP-dependent Lon-type protease
VTANVNAQLAKKPNLDIKTSITGLERTMDMMCEVSQKSPSIFLEAFQPLRMPDQTRRIIEKCIESNLPKNFACGMLVSSMNPISIFTDPE